MLGTTVRQARQPMIRFLGKRTIPSNIDHKPQPHPASAGSLPDSFASYRQKAQQHGPLTGSSNNSNNNGGARTFGGLVGGHSGASLGSVQAARSRGEVFDRDELPARFRRGTISLAEIEAVESGGASLWA